MRIDFQTYRLQHHTCWKCEAPSLAPRIHERETTSVEGSTSPASRRPGFSGMMSSMKAGGLLVLFASCIAACGDLAPDVSTMQSDGSTDASRCASDESLCAGSCVDEQTDSNNCGGCGKTCGGSVSLCANGACTKPSLSCAQGGAGLADCGAGHESCCASLEVASGTYYRTYDLAITPGGQFVVTLAPNGGPTGEADPATLSGFRLDKYLVTVGRFRQFVNARNGGTGYMPPAGSGKHAYLNGGNGLVDSATAGAYEKGWIL